MPQPSDSRSEPSRWFHWQSSVVDPACSPRLPCKRDIASEEGAIWSLILWQGGRERGPKNEEEEEIGDGQSTAPLMPGCKMSHWLAITVVAHEKCSEEVVQVTTLHQQIRLRAVLETLQTALTSTMRFYLPCNPN